MCFSHHNAWSPANQWVKLQKKLISLEGLQLKVASHHTFLVTFFVSDFYQKVPYYDKYEVCQTNYFLLDNSHNL